MAWPVVDMVDHYHDIAAAGQLFDEAGGFGALVAQARGIEHDGPATFALVHRGAEVRVRNGPVEGDREP
jgi:hypothetical protein